jgi:AAA+ superfamily predicted ATPase
MIHYNITSILDNAKSKLALCDDIFQKECIQAFIDNYEYYELKEYYQNKKTELQQQKDSNCKLIQLGIQHIESKLLNINNQYHTIEHDITSFLTDNLALAYTDLLNKYNTLLTCKQIMLNRQNYQFRKWGFYHLVFKGQPIPSFTLENPTAVAFILPTCFLIYVDASNFELVPFSISVVNSNIRFSKSTECTNCRFDFIDSDVISEKWRHSNIDGSPDKRFSNNQHYYIVEVGDLNFYFHDTYTWYSFSHVKNTHAFYNSYLNLINTYESNKKQTRRVVLSTDEFVTKKIDDELKQSGETPKQLAFNKNSSKHQVGEKHPTKPWVWTEYAPGKYDWRKDKNLIQQQIKEIHTTSTENNAVQELENLIGLSNVKQEIVRLQNFIQIQQIRKSKGLKTSPISYHCIFTGNPGTGKTTVARIVADIYKELGVLSKGHLIETDRSGLVAEYVGQTAVKTNAVIDSALDGVLFIDEAYSLVTGSSNDFGLEAIATLLKRMEDERNRLIVILAGYENKMKQFIDANPGLQSRFNRYIHFEDYTKDELLSIFDLNLKKNEYSIAADAKSHISDIIDDAIAHKDQNFGNARFVRNLFEKILENQALRLSKENKLDKESLQLITRDDTM